MFISPSNIAGKVIRDNTYSNKSRCIVGQGTVLLREIGQMDREMCSYLEWQLNVDPTELREFEHKVRRDFKGQGPYPTYNLPSPAPSPMPSTTPYTSTGTTRAPSFVTGQIAAGAGASAAPVAAPVAKPAPPRSGSQPIPIPERAYPSPPHSPDTPETPEASRSLSTSPASSASPPTPPGEVDLTVKIATPGGSVPMSVDPARMHTKHASSASTASSSSRPYAGSRAPAPRSKRSAELFAVAQPVAW